MSQLSKLIGSRGFGDLIGRMSETLPSKETRITGDQASTTLKGLRRTILWQSRPPRPARDVRRTTLRSG